MKKYIPIIAVFCLFFSSYVWAAEVSVTAESATNNNSASALASASTSGSDIRVTCISCATIKITATPVPGQYYRMITIDYRFPAGFPSWAEEVTGAVYSDPLLVLWDKIENIESERIKQGGYFIKGQAYFWTEGGCLVIKKTFAANPGDFIQLLATTWSGLKYELAFDKPGSVINRIYCLSGAIQFAQLSDGSWGPEVQ